ncbi:hypothetical protein [Streptomyces sp. NPDC001404]|uniref:hypothetical protein n=1 Tax=Streptomyces sp. NPDC001404 TaxID=3364571 RepID=UPI0036CC2CB9
MTIDDECDECDEYDEYGDDYEEWQAGQCDNCTGVKPGNGVGITPVCACAIGQGASSDDCVCGPVGGEVDA